MVSKKIKTKCSSKTWKEQKDWEEYLRRMCTSQTAETEVCCASEPLYGDSVKRNKNKSKKLKRKKKEKHLCRKAEAPSYDDNGFEANVRRKNEKKLKKHKNKKQNKNKEKSERKPLAGKQRKDKKSKSFGGSDQSNMNLLHQCTETCASQEIMLSDSGSGRYGSVKLQHPVCEGSHLLKQEPVQGHCQIHPKSKSGTPHRKNIDIDPFPCSFKCVNCKVKKQKAGREHIEPPEPSAHGTCGKETLHKSILVSRKAHVTFEDEAKAFDPLMESDSKASQVTAENNSQELFITQKTFQPAESSSEESSCVTGPFTEPNDWQCDRLCPELSQELFLSKSTTENATQTDDFFSSPVLTTSLRFHKLHQKQKCTEQALDLSMPKRLHREPTGSTNWQAKQQHEETNCDSFGPKLTGTFSHEQNRMLALSKAGSAQVKGVQTRLNESFFFRMKGGGESSKPQSPLLDHGVTKSKMLQMRMYMKGRCPLDPNS